MTDSSLVFGDHSKIESHKLKGVWNRVEPNNQTVEFVDTLLEVMLIIKNEQSYYFTKDSAGYVYSSGFFPLWPPLNCDLKFISKDTLKIKYSQMGEGVSYLYVKSKAK